MTITANKIYSLLLSHLQEESTKGVSCPRTSLIFTPKGYSVSSTIVQKESGTVVSRLTILDMQMTRFSSLCQMKSCKKSSMQLSTPADIHLHKAYIWSTLLYGCESWTLTAKICRNLEDAEMYFYHRMDLVRRQG